MKKRVGLETLTRDLEGSIEDAIKVLQKLSEKHKDHSDLKLEYEDVSDDPYERDPRYGYRLYGTREESEYERKSRVDLEKKQQAHKAASERQLYENLKKKYENKP